MNENLETPVVNKEEVVENKEAVDTTEQLKKLVEKQSETIDKLIKQQELTNKINQQMAATLLNSADKENVNEDSYAWQEKVIREKFNLNSNIDLQNIKNKEQSEQLAVWMLKYLKDKGLSKEQVQFRMDRLFKGIEGVTPHEDIK